MVYFCDSCKQVYELNRNDVRCIYCGSYACSPYQPPKEDQE